MNAPLTQPVLGTVRGQPGHQKQKTERQTGKQIIRHACMEQIGGEPPIIPEHENPQRDEGPFSMRQII